MKKAIFLIFLPFFMVLAIMLEMLRPLTYFERNKAHRFWNFLLLPILVPILLMFALLFAVWVKLAE